MGPGPSQSKRGGGMLPLIQPRQASLSTVSWTSPGRWAMLSTSVRFPVMPPYSTIVASRRLQLARAVDDSDRLAPQQEVRNLRRGRLQVDERRGPPPDSPRAHEKAHGGCSPVGPEDRLAYFFSKIKARISVIFLLSASVTSVAKTPFSPILVNISFFNP